MKYIWYLGLVQLIRVSYQYQPIRLFGFYLGMYKGYFGGKRMELCPKKAKILKAGRIGRRNASPRAYCMVQSYYIAKELLCKVLTIFFFFFTLSH